MSEQRVGVLGASSMVGECLLSQLSNSGCHVTAFSRRVIANSSNVDWQLLPVIETSFQIRDWICVAPIWVLPEYFDMFEAYGARRVVAVSSTSRFTKVNSGDVAEHETVAKLVSGEEQLQAWAQSRGIEWTVLRPTLIYGLGRDKNISEIVRVIRRFGCFPLFGQAKGLRQPIHATDVAAACLAALNSPLSSNRSYNISGGETLTYRDMVERVFDALDRRPRVLSVPLWAFRFALAVFRYLPRYRHWSAAMAERMNQDLIFDQTDTLRDLGLTPRVFKLMPEDLPK
ncbi:NAD-dependent epimerase/dehydratase family protein [Zwartia vadi]|uniref:NAD-dependent epimerase/dehydratase family protein n=1 Tax=Zwartia vadi TaxID=3058168 RepID=UPI0025B43DE8|nr:NAD-dependent epimerase/dehydratase family protein [Zwartia vadi]MDN3987413.1 NAD-dependent epimerase/dehydratase family protein [Zwartia vadi]